MKVAIMQPYFLPYIGYFQLIGSADLFIVYDNIKYTKKGWINRNRMLLNENDVIFSLPLKKGSDCLDVIEREISPDFNREKLLNQIAGAYRKAPCFSTAFPVMEQIINNSEPNLFRLIHSTICSLCQHFGLKTKILISSEIKIDHTLKGQDKVLALSAAVGATTYINAIGGLELYDKRTFYQYGIELKFIKSKPFVYQQFSNEFIPWLSIMDVMMFNPLGAIQECISNNYELI